MSGVVTLFGSSSPVEGDDEYDIAFQLGKRLATEGYSIRNGGYMGTMEASAKGASIVDKYSVTGVTVPSLFPHRKEQGNRFLSETEETVSLGDRLGKLCENSDAFIVLPGQAGTLLELCFVWNLHYISSFSQRDNRPIIAFREPWKGVIEHLVKSIGMPEETISSTFSFVDTVEEVIDTLKNIKE